MRPFILALVAFLCVDAYADRLIDMPLGRKLPYGTVRFESRFDQSDFKHMSSSIDWGIDSSWEGSLRYSSARDEARLVTGDISYNYFAPLTDVAPGISLGVQDVANKTLEGRRLYAVTTYKMGGVDLWSPVEFTIGAQYMRRVSVFVGAMFPLTPKLRLLAEHDGARISAGGEWRQSPGLAFRYVFRDSIPVLSFRIQTKL